MPGLRGRTDARNDGRQLMRGGLLSVFACLWACLCCVAVWLCVHCAQQVAHRVLQRIHDGIQWLGLSQVRSLKYDWLWQAND